MPYPLSNTSWPVMIDQKLTFFGVLVKYYDDIGLKYSLSTSTNEQYAKQCEKYIIPRLNDHPLENYSAEDFDKVISDIRSSESRCAEATLQIYRRHIIRVVEMAVGHEGMKDPLFGVVFMPPTTPKNVETSEKKTLPRSLTVHQQCVIAKTIYSSADAQGKNIDLMVEFEAGLRPKETAGLSFGDFVYQDGFGIAALHNSTIGQGHARHAKMKTKNSYRKVIFSEKASNIIEKRRHEICDLLYASSVVDHALEIVNIPIAGMDDNPTMPRSSVQVSKEYRALLRDIGFDENDYLAACRIVASDEFSEAEKHATPEELGFAKVKSPTVYINRRQYCTDMHIVGCTPEEIQYLMGHKIENSAVDRRYYNNSDELKKLAEKLNKRPSVNESVLSPLQNKLSGDTYKNEDFHEESIQIPLRKGKLRIWVSNHEAIDPITVNIYVPDGVEISGSYYEREDLSPQNKTVNVLTDYYAAFRESYRKIEDVDVFNSSNQREKEALHER